MLLENDAFQRRFMVSDQNSLIFDCPIIFAMFLHPSLVFLISMFIFQFQDFLFEPIDILVKLHVLFFCSLSEKIPPVHLHDDFDSLVVQLVG